jgi:hypothetical protein
VSSCSVAEAEPFLLTPFPFGRIHLLCLLLSAAIALTVSGPFVAVTGELGRGHNGVAIGIHLCGRSVAVYAGGYRRNCAGVPTLLSSLSAVCRFKLVGSFEVSHYPLDFLRERVVVLRLYYSGRVHLSGVREGVLQVANLYRVRLTVSAGT